MSTSIFDIIKKKANEFDVENFREFNVAGKCSYTDQFVIMTASSTMRIKSLAEKIIFECKHAGYPALSIEGLEEAEWCLLDFGEVIVNIMMQDKRDFFQLEKIWENMD